MSRVVDAIFRITDEFSTPLQNFQTALTDAGRQGKNLRKQVADMGKGIANVGKALTATVTVPIIAAGTAAVTYAGEVSQSMELARATAAQSAEEWAAAENAAAEAAKAHTFTMADASEATLNFARQGFKAEDIAYLMGNAMDYAQGTATDLAQTSAGLGNIMKGFGLEMEETTRVADQLAKAQALANTNGSELLDGVQMMAPTMRTLGYDTADAAALIAAWGDSGVSAAEGATAFKTSMARLAKPTKEASTAMAAIGFEMFDDAGNAKDLITVQEELNQCFSGLSAQEKEAYASMMFGKNQMSKMLMVIDTAPEKFQALEEGIRNSNGTANELSSTMMGSLGGSIESLKSSLDVLKYSFGTLLGTYVQPLIEKVTEFVDKLNSLDDAQKQQIIRYAGIAAAVGPCLLVFGKLIIFASKVMTAFSKIHAAGGLVKAGFAAFTGPGAIVIGIIGAIVAIAAVFITHMDEVKASIQTLSENAAPYLQQLGDSFSGLMEVVQPVLDFLVGTFVNGVLGAFDALMSGGGIVIFLAGVRDFVDGITELLGGLITFLTGVFTGDWQAAWDGLSSIFTGVFDVIKGVAESFFGTLTAGIEGVMGALQGVGNFAKGAYDSTIGKVVNKVAGNASGTSYWQGGLTRVNESGGEIMNLPSGTQIIPHDASRNTATAASGANVTIPKLADTIVVREDADIDRITDQLVRKLMKASGNMGSVSMA